VVATLGAILSRFRQQPSRRHPDTGGPTMLARIALNRHVERVFNPRSQGDPLGGKRS